MYILYIIITNENRLEANVKKLNILILSSLSSTSTGLSPKNFQKRAHPTDDGDVKSDDGDVKSDGGDPDKVRLHLFVSQFSYNASDAM